MRAIGLDVHRDFCEVAIVEAGVVRSAGRIATTPQTLELFAGSLGRDDRVALEVTGNAWEIARILEPHVRYARHRLRELRERQTGLEVWAWDTWPVDRIDPDGHWAHQHQRRIYFADIDPPWLKALAKRWARWRLSAATKSPAGIQRVTSALRRFSAWLATRRAARCPSAITRALLERFLADLRIAPASGTRVRAARAAAAPPSPRG